MSEERPSTIEKKALSEADLLGEGDPAELTRDRSVPTLPKIDAEPTAAPVYRDPTRIALDETPMLHVDPAVRLNAFIEGQVCLGDLFGLPQGELYELAVQAERLFRAGNLVGAEAAFSGLTALMPTCDDFHTGLGAVYHRQRRNEEASIAYSRALGLNPLNISARVNRAELYLEQGEIDAALEDLALARRADPEGSNPHSERTRAVTLALVNLLKEFGAS
jgi:tetratricopeptide (TPR) repeat protein